MLRKFNFTGRQRIKHSGIDIVVYKKSDERYFDVVSLDLEGLNLQGDASIYIEPYFKSSFKRFYFGTVGEMVQPEEGSLEELPESERILFRIKITDESGTHGRLLAFAEGISPRHLEEVTAESRCILPVDFTDTGPRIWRLSFPEYGTPTLEMSNKIENGRDVVRSNEFITLVYPAVVKEIASKITFFEEDYDEEGDQWQSLWLKYFYRKLRVHPKPSMTEDNKLELENWVDAVEEGFCRRFNVQQRFRKTGVMQ